MSADPMQILIVGRGGREHALAWSLARSPRPLSIAIAPGNAGTMGMTLTGGAKVAHLAIDELDTNGLVAAARELHTDLVIIGPEAPLAAGLADAMAAAGIACFGPSKAAARLESSKAFAKAFMQRHGIATADYAVFTDFAAALAYVRLAHAREATAQVVVKASGLAAGKGVVLPVSLAEAEAALRAMMVDKCFGSAADEVIIEARLSGPEVSVLAFCDGKTVSVMPVAQDHKRAFDGDLGLNTGGMGAIAPSRLVDAQLLIQIRRTILQRAVDGLAAEGYPFIGVIFAGIMLTPAGPSVLEFNSRFGDPETQAILPLLESDLAGLLLDCAHGRLASRDIVWRKQTAVSVVAASAGYPGPYQTGRAITGLDRISGLPDCVAFCAGVRQDEIGRIMTDGGRVLSVTGLGLSVAEARERAYAGLSRIHFDGMHYRTDIGANLT